MKSAAFFVLLALLVTPFSVSAHEHNIFNIGGTLYDFTIGSLNEPVMEDDKSGLELAVWTVGTGSVSGKPVTGLETTLKVEVRALHQSRVMDIVPAWGEEGSYHAVFYPTANRQFSYRLFGKVNDVPFDATFACNGAGHEMHGLVVTQPGTVLSDQVTHVEKRGAFGCPKAKAAFGFPNRAISLSTMRTIATLGLIFGLIGTAAGVWSVLEIRKKR